MLTYAQDGHGITDQIFAIQKIAKVFDEAPERWLIWCMSTGYTYRYDIKLNDEGQLVSDMGKWSGSLNGNPWPDSTFTNETADELAEWMGIPVKDTKQKLLAGQIDTQPS